MIRFDSVSYRYRPGLPPALAEVSLDLPKGQVTAVLGPNGAGKSTLLFLALAWLQPCLGRITLDGRPLANYSRREMGRLMGLVPQREHIQFEYSVVEYVLLGRLPHLAPLEQPGEEDYSVAFDALQQVGMDRFAHRSVLKLSGGEKQLVLIARSLAQQPSFLLLDEPTSHLDLHNRSRLIALLRQFQARGVTILMTTHEPELASALASTVILVNEGKVLFCGTAEQALTTENLSSLYRLPVEVVQLGDRRIVLW